MLKSNLNVLFYLKKPKGYRSGTLPIYVLIGVDSISKEISTKWNCEPKKWHTQFQKAMGSSEDVRTLNTDIAKLLSKIYAAEEALRKNDAIVTADAIKQIISGKSPANHLLLGIFKKHNENMFALIGKDYAKGTFERYETSLQHTRAFIKYKYGTDDIDIKKLNFDFISGYEFWLKTVRNCNHNTTMKYLANFRKIINSCIRHGWLSKDPFVGFKMTKKEVIKVILTDEELKTIRGKSFCTPRLNHVRDIFIFCYINLFVLLSKLIT
ncbi:MAG: phage integrase SAM-like domain-containing protein [Flavipsychrobacter sp.]|nr:phage integrase SAM-like domain-containing protein [Flavipsychrobacter sp.]